MEKIGVIDVGGGLRGIYAAGVFDWCMDNGVQFDYGIGISAGSANLASYLSGQRGRNYLFYEEYSMRRAVHGRGQYAARRVVFEPAIHLRHIEQPRAARIRWILKKCLPIRWSGI